MINIFQAVTLQYVALIHCDLFSSYLFLISYSVLQNVLRDKLKIISVQSLDRCADNDVTTSRKNTGKYGYFFSSDKNCCTTTFFIFSALTETILEIELKYRFE